MNTLNKLKIFLSLFVIALYIGCSDTPPSIIQLFTQPNIIQDETAGAVLHQFSVFLHLEDEDGVDDIESIYLIHDGEELFWELNSENWETVTDGDETWIGSNGIAFPGNLTPASGLFRVIVVDAAGERTAEELYIQPPAKGDRIPFPKLDNLETGAHVIKGTGRQHTLWYFDQSGKIVNSHKTSDKTIPAPKPEDRVNSVYVYTYSDENGCGVISGPYQLTGP